MRILPYLAKRLFGYKLLPIENINYYLFSTYSVLCPLFPIVPTHHLENETPIDPDKISEEICPAPWGVGFEFYVNLELSYELDFE